jgi:hypothetical protein
VTSVVVEEKDRKGNESLVDGSWSHGIDVSNMSYIPTSVMWQWLGMQVFLKSLQSGPKEAASVVSESPPAISSAFTPSYSLLLNLVSKYSLPQVIINHGLENFITMFWSSDLALIPRWSQNC